jgi:prophage tail gpP-like protein
VTPSNTNAVADRRQIKPDDTAVSALSKMERHAAFHVLSKTGCTLQVRAHLFLQRQLPL